MVKIKVRRSDGVVFDSISEAAEETPGAIRSHISKVCKGVKGYTQTGGYSWKYVDQPEGRRKIKRSDGAIFNSATEAVECGGSPACVRRACRDGSKYLGFLWEYVRR